MSIYCEVALLTLLQHLEQAAIARYANNGNSSTFLKGDNVGDHVVCRWSWLVVGWLQR